MKKYLNSIFVFLLLFVVSISLTGCGSKEENKDIDDIINKVENSNKKNDDEKDNKNSKNDSNEYDDIKLYSDDTKIVFNMENLYYIIFYHNGNEVTGLEYIYDYEDKETAKFFEATWRASYEAQEDVEKVELKGKQLRIKFKKSAYDGQTLESIKQTYSYLEELKGN